MIEGDKDSFRAVQDALDLAMAKLTATWGTKIADVRNAGKLAVFDVLLSIGYDRTEEAACALEAEMVRFHMRTAFSIPEHCQYVVSGYPSAIFGGGSLSYPLAIATRSLGPLEQA